MCNFFNFCMNVLSTGEQCVCDIVYIHGRENVNELKRGNTPECVKIDFSGSD